MSIKLHPPVPFMEDLAAELLVDIFEFACVGDDGQTARSLSLISRRIREASRPFLFRAIFLHATPTKLQQLIHRMEVEHERCPEMRPRCRHLFLECPHMDPDELAEFPTIDDSPTSFHGEPSSSVLSYSTHQRMATFWEQWSRLVSSLLRATAPDLETFTFVSHSDFPGPIAFPCFFPALRELCVVSCGLSPSSSVTTTHPPVFPSLQRLHLVSLSEEFPSSFASLVQHTPKLTHLRVSNLARQLNLRALLNLYKDSNPDPALPNLQRVLIQPSSPPWPDGPCGSPYMLYLDFVTRLWCSAQLARVPVYLVPGNVKFREADHEIFVQKTREEWLDRIAGREGCWAVEEDWANRNVDGHAIPWHLLLMARERGA
ncbi:hypothetical protein BD311DRAFT_801179 [Dichomitus squalens]|uniref:F-box domain-containing protein n=1 Tax=Dichomitus squalens TaxID=114155 RepID=A0A4Q9N4P1_9APHY|nr:hypothetical protein BD311DRAFT_801179 [Dichomitus squalens]